MSGPFAEIAIPLLIAIGKHGRNMVEELLLGSVTKHVLAESAGDVLVSTSREGRRGR